MLGPGLLAKAPHLVQGARFVAGGVVVLVAGWLADGVADGFVDELEGELADEPADGLAAGVGFGNTLAQRDATICSSPPAAGRRQVPQVQRSGCP